MNNANNNSKLPEKQKNTPGKFYKEQIYLLFFDVSKTNQIL
jgi:hypothetical protein